MYADDPTKNVLHCIFIENNQVTSAVEMTTLKHKKLQAIFKTKKCAGPDQCAMSRNISSVIVLYIFTHLYHFSAHYFFRLINSVARRIHFRIITLVQQINMFDLQLKISASLIELLSRARTIKNSKRSASLS